MKITIEHEGIKLSIEDEDILTITDALGMVKRALQGVGYYIEGDLIDDRGDIFTDEN